MFLQLLLSVLLLSLVTLIIVYTSSRSRNPLVYPLIALLLLPDIIISITLFINQFPTTSYLLCNVVSKAVHLVWMVKSTSVVVLTFIIYKWVVNDQVQHVEWTSKQYMGALGVYLFTLSMPTLLFGMVSWYGWRDGVCSILHPYKASSTILVVHFITTTLLLLFVFMQLITVMNHSMQSMSRTPANLINLRIGLAILLALMAIYLFLQASRYLIWLVVMITLNGHAYHEASLLNQPTNVSHLEAFTSVFECCVLWLDVIGCVVLFTRLPPSNESLAFSKQRSSTLASKRKSGRPSLTVFNEPFTARSNEKKDEVLFVAPPITPTASFMKNWSPIDSRDAQLLHKDPVVPDPAITRSKLLMPIAGEGVDGTPIYRGQVHKMQVDLVPERVPEEEEEEEEEFSNVRQSYSDQLNIFASVSTLPSIQEDDAESMHDILMSDDEERTVY